MYTILLLMVANLCDIAATYFIASKLVKRLVSADIRNVLVAVSYSVIFGTISYMFGHSTIFQILVITAQFIIVYLIVKKKISSSLIAFGIYYSLITLFQSLFVVAILVFNLEQTIVITTIVQFVTVLFAILVYKLVPINRLFAFIEKHLLLKLVILALAFIGIILVLYHNIYVGGNFWFILSGIALIVVIFISLCTLGREIYRMTYTNPLNQHDLKISFYGSLINAYKEENHKQIEELEALGKKNNLDLNYEFQLGKAKENIIEFINRNRLICDQDVEIRNNIVYYKDHHAVGIDVVTKLLGILLDNALESGTKKPIIVKVLVDLGNINIEVSNEYQLTSPDAINRMFDKGFSTKGTTRGFGLDNLYRTVQEYGGKVITDYDYNGEMKSNYLTFVIEI